MGVELVVGAVVAGGFGAGFGFAGLTGAAAFFAAAGTSLALQMVSQALSPAVGNFSDNASAATRQIRQSMATRRVIYGECRVSGPIAVFTTTGDGKYLHIVILLAGHEIDSIRGVYFDDLFILIPPGYQGMVNNAYYAGHAQIYYGLGSPDQVAHPNMLANIPGWNANRRFRGCAYLYCVLTSNPDYYPNGIPNITAVVRGKKVYDPRSGITQYSDNSALCLRDYLTDTTYGRSAAAAEVNDSYAIAAANTSDEMVSSKVAVFPINTFVSGIGFQVPEPKFCPLMRGEMVYFVTTGTLPPPLQPATLYYVSPWMYSMGYYGVATSLANARAGIFLPVNGAGVGSHVVVSVAQPRYTTNGFIESDRKPYEVLQELTGAMAGRLTRAGNQWTMYAGAYQSPTVFYDESDMTGPIKVQTAISRREQFNCVKGTITGPPSFWQPASYPNLKNSGYIAMDGGQEIYKELDLPFTAMAQAAQRIASIELERSRRQNTAQVRMNLTAMQSQPGDTIGLTVADFGWENKVFEVTEWTLAVNNEGETPRLEVIMNLRETDASIFTWDAEAQSSLGAPAEETTFSSPFDIQPPASIELASGADELYIKDDGTVISRLKIAWTESPSNGVEYYEVQYKKSADSVWQPSIICPADVFLQWVFDVQDGALYDVRIRSKSTLGTRSPYLTVTNHFVIGKTESPENVQNFSAQQNGDVVLFRWDQTSDKDIAGYEIRYVRN